MYKSMVEGMDDAQKQSFIDYYGSMEEWEKHMRYYFAHLRKREDALVKDTAAKLLPGKDPEGKTKALKGPEL